MNDTDDAVRRLARANDEQVARATGTEAREALLERIVAMPAPAAPARTTRRRRPLVAGVAAVTIAASGTIGWAIVKAGDSRDTTSLQCQIGGSPSIISAVSGDPVTDCAAQWERDLGSAAPPLTAYDNGHGGVLVQPAADPAPPGATPLPPGGQNVALIDLQESLDDYVAGLSSRCFTRAEAVAFAGAQLARTGLTGLTGWTVTPRSGGRCTNAAAADPATRTVWLLAQQTDPTIEEGGHVELAARLREIAKQCRPVAATRTLVDKAVRDLGVGVQVTEVPTAARCTTIRQRVGGTIFVTLRGPA